jgi:5-methylcytosine-specific restriction enzyme A
MIRPCLEPACPNPATYRGRCHQHARTRDRNTNRAGYHLYRTKRWRITRDRYLAEHPICECEHDCGQIATDVHHRTPLDAGGPPWDFSNLQALHHACHSRQTRREQLERGRGG